MLSRCTARVRNWKLQCGGSTPCGKNLDINPNLPLTPLKQATIIFTKQNHLSIKSKQVGLSKILSFYIKFLTFRNRISWIRKIGPKTLGLVGHDLAKGSLHYLLQQSMEYIQSVALNRHGTNIYSGRLFGDTYCKYFFRKQAHSLWCNKSFLHPAATILTKNNGE